MKIAIGADHGGYPLKADIIQVLTQTGHQLIDLGAYVVDAGDDYPDFALAVGKSLQAGQAERGIVICGSGVGASIAASKMKGIRAGVCHDTYSAHQGVEHDDMNVLCLGGRIIGPEVAKELIAAFLSAKFSDEARFHRRFEMVQRMENGESFK